MDKTTRLKLLGNLPVKYNTNQLATSIAQKVDSIEEIAKQN